MVKNTNGYYLQDNTRGKGIFTYNAKNRTSLPGSLWVEKQINIQQHLIGPR